MARHRSHAVKKHPVNDNHSGKHPSRQSQVVRLHPEPPAEPVKTPFFFSWPAHFFELMMTSLRGFTPMGSWMEADTYRTKSTRLLPQTETRETSHSYIYRVALPGVSPVRIHLIFQNNTLKLAIDDVEKPRRKFHPRTPPVRRAFTLPTYTNGMAITAQLKNGILTITVPKTDHPVASQPRSIPIT